MINEERDLIIKNLLQSSMDLDEIAKTVGYNGISRKARVDSLRKYCSRREDLRDLYSQKSGSSQQGEDTSPQLSELFKTLSESIMKMTLETAIESKSLKLQMDEGLSQINHRLNKLEASPGRTSISAEADRPLECDASETTIPSEVLKRPETYDFIQGDEVKQTSIRIWSKALEDFDEFAKNHRSVGSKWELMSMALEEFVHKYSKK